MNISFHQFEVVRHVYIEVSCLVFMEKRSTHFALMIVLAFILVFASSFAFVSAVSSSTKIADVGYILVNKRNPNQDILNVFSELGLSYTLIEDRNVLKYYSNGSLSRFRFLFVDDFRLNNARKIPISNFPSVIMNSYYGKDWGLTDNEGVSQLTSNVPLEVRMINDGILQVYTMSQASMVGEFIPYFYIDDLNKANMTSVARTYVGGITNINDFGDVIGYLANGTRLLNGKTSNGKMCFFGIAKTKYWTPEARQMFLDCVGYVGTVCSFDSDCGTNSTGLKYCSGTSGKDVYQDSSRMRCIYPNSARSECVADSTPQFVESCDYGCANGACLPQCTLNPLNLSNCGSESYSANFCILNNVTRTHQMPTCSLLGTCGFDIINETVAVCAYGCLDGNCLPRCTKNSDCDDLNGSTEDICLYPNTLNSTCVHNPIICSSNSDCGTDGYVGNAFCSLNGSYQNYTTFTCNNAGTSSSVCSNSTNTRLLQQCAGSCTNGLCVECLKDTDCGVDFFSNKFCNGPSGKDVFRNFTDYTCSNFRCVVNTTKILNETCSDTCIDGSCRNIVCSSNSDCDDDSVYTLDECANPGTTQSFCTHTPINCVSNLDCGTTGNFGNEYCMNNGIFKNYQNATCLNPGTINSICVISQAQVLGLNCGTPSYGNWSGNFCKNGDVYHSRSSFDKGCFIPSNGNATCFSNQSGLTDSLVQECDLGCSNGACLIPQCTINPLNLSKCVSESYSAKFCIAKNVTRYHITPTCSIQGTCGVNNVTETVQVCDYGCLNGNCTQPQCTRNSDCGSASSSLVCQGDDSYNKTITPTCSLLGTCSNVNSSVLFEDCAYGCANGHCLPQCTQNSDCDDGVFCNGGETCANSRCVSPSASVNCSGFNLPAIAKCDNVPDSNPFTWDTASAFVSQCSESLKGCTTSSYNFMHMLIIGKCGVACLNNSGCSGLTNNYCDGEVAVHNLGVCSGTYSCVVNSTRETCDHDCLNGQCVDECSQDSDCEADYYGPNYCYLNDSYHDFHNFGCDDRSCLENVTKVLVEDCAYGCANGECNEPEPTPLCESNLKIDVTYFANYNFGARASDMSDNIFVGTNKSIYGTGSVVIPLTKVNRTSVITDALLSSKQDNVPGLHVQRGKDSKGSYAEISAYGFNSENSRESIKANVSFENAVISKVVNFDAGPYESSNYGGCGIVEGNPKIDNTGNDAYLFDIGGNRGSICSSTNVDRDRVRVYYIPSGRCVQE